MEEHRLKKIIDKHVEMYINNIAHELEESHERWFENFGFPMFGEISKEYYEQIFFESYLEHYTRVMINGILKEMLDEENSDLFVWPEFEYPGGYIGYSNKECEQKFGFEFINRDQKIGYRYVFFYADEINELLNKEEEIKTIVLVKWENEDDIHSFHYGDARARVILVLDLFKELFNELNEEHEIHKMYDLFIESINKAVKKANSLISLTTLPGFTPSYLGKIRDELLRDLRKEISFLCSFHIENNDYKNIEENSKQLIERYNLNHFFLNNKMEYSIVGKSIYAKSFLTSEYLYRFFKNNPMFDFTPIVSGYIKSVEQLLGVLCESYDISRTYNNDLSNYTLGAYTTYINNNRMLFRKELRSDCTIIVQCLKRFRIETRNQLFHKDYLQDWNKVEQIRANTIFLMVVLLGAVDPTLVRSDSSILGVLNDKYDNLFRVLDKQTEHHFTFILDGKEYTGMEKVRRYEGIKYDENGMINNTILFRKEEYGCPEIIKIVISRTNMPSEIWISDSFGVKKERKIWPPISDDSVME